MNVKGSKLSPSGFKIMCSNYPSEFMLDKNLAKEYFRQFGKIKRISFKSKLRTCTIEYVNKEGFLKALNTAGEYNGKFFKVTAEKPPEEKKKKLAQPPLYLDNDDIKAELEAMGGYAPKDYNTPEIKVSAVIGLIDDSLESLPKPKLKRAWNTELAGKQKKITKTKDSQSLMETPEQSELRNLIKSQATTIEEKYRVLDARDKLIRLKLKKNATMKTSPTVGTCPDMCPEKERLMRETQHQVALYEQADNGKAMNQSKAVKQYSRSSADQEAPLPHELRPVSVLQMTMAYLMHNIVDLCDSDEVNLAEWFHFLWDRTRGIRKDITQQELCCQGGVELVEQCARFHIHCSARLVAEDPSVFDQKINTENLTKCLQSLKYMYHDLQLKGESCPNEAEFRGYIILLNLNDGNFMWEVQELREEIQKSKEVRFALEVYSALDKNNYVKFFKLVNSTTYLNACTLMRYFVQVRVTAIKTLLKCYTPRAFKTVYPLSKLTQLLCFDDIESTMDFMQAYGISINEEKTYIVLEKNTFMLPEFPYLLERSLNVVESKRMCSVGKIVCGKNLPPKSFENHIPQDSFDQKGYLILEDLLDESDLKAEENEEAVDTEIGAQSIFTSPVPTIKKPEHVNIFAQKGVVSPIGNIFGQTKREIAVPVESNTSIFGQPALQTQKSIFSGEPVGIFVKTEEETMSVDQTDFKQFAPFEDQAELAPSTGIFPKQVSKSIFSKPAATTKSIFGATVSQPVATVLPKIFPSPAKPKGGFTFNLPKTPTEIAATNIFGISVAHSAPTHFVMPTPEEQEKIPIASIKMPVSINAPAVAPEITNVLKLEKNKEKKQEEEQRRLKRLEEKRKKELERKIIEEKRKEEERLKEVKRKNQEKELRKRMEELRKEERRLKNEEIKNTVKSVVSSMVNVVAHKLKQERLEEIKDKIRRRLALSFGKRWQQVVLKNKRKRKAMDCTPIWISQRTVQESAEDLRSTSQDLTLKLKKRYKFGKSLDIELPAIEKITKINLFHITFPTLNRRFFDLNGILQKTIFWKVEISLPDHYELRNGIERMEETLKDAFQWEDRNGTVMAVEQGRPNAVQSVTYCIERQRGLYVRYVDTNGIIFIAKDFNSLLQRRIFENLKDFGVFTRVPIVIILQEYGDEWSNLKTLIDEKIVSDCVILVDNLTPTSLVNLIEEGLAFLAGKVEKPPPLELDTLSGFITKHLCTETWKRANSFAKWNSHYKTCLKNPNIIISLYNEALTKLKKIALNKSCFEYALFPELFKDYLESEIPDCLPCNYYYFPKFWKSDAYTAKLEHLFDSLTLPRWQEAWPPSSEFDLEVDLSKYCVNTFVEPEKPFYRIMRVLLQNIDPNLNFKNIKNTPWTNIVEVLSLEKLRQTNLSFTGTQFETKSVFNQYFVVYNKNALEEYKKSDWFYVNHPLVDMHVKQLLNAEKKEEAKKIVNREPDYGLDLDKIIDGLSSKAIDKVKTVQMKRELTEFNSLLDDLENSIRIHKKISTKFEETLKMAIENN